MSQVYLSFSHLMGLLRIRGRGKVSEIFRDSAWTVAISHGGDFFDSGWISLTFLQNHVNEAENHRTNTATVKTARVEMVIDQSFNQFGNLFT